MQTIHLLIHNSKERSRPILTSILLLILVTWPSVRHTKYVDAKNVVMLRLTQN